MKATGGNCWQVKLVPMKPDVTAQISRLKMDQSNTVDRNHIIYKTCKPTCIGPSQFPFCCAPASFSAQDCSVEGGGGEDEVEVESEVEAT